MDGDGMHATVHVLAWGRNVKVTGCNVPSRKSKTALRVFIGTKVRRKPKE